MVKALLVANIRSGSRTLNVERVNVLAESARGAAGNVVAFPEKSFGEQIAMTASSDYDIILAAGGDGTVRAIAQTNIKAPKPIAILPFGTMNMLARELGVPSDPDLAASSSLNGGIKPIDVGVIGGQVFLHSALMGTPVRVGVHRERHRGMLAFADAISIGVHTLFTLRRDRHLSLDVIAGGHSSDGPIDATTIAAIVGEPSEQLLPVPRRSSLDCGHLTFFAIHAHTAPKIVRSLLHEAVGTLEHDENVRIVRAPSAVVTGPGQKIHALLDGERQLFRSPMSIEIKPRAQPMIVPMAAGLAGIAA